MKRKANELEITLNNAIATLQERGLTPDEIIDNLCDYLETEVGMNLGMCTIEDLPIVPVDEDGYVTVDDEDEWVKLC